MEKIITYTPIPDETFDNIKNECYQEWKNNLQKYGIIFPKPNTCKYYQLLFLYYYKTQMVHKNVITQFIHEKIPEASGDQQIRHLAGICGYNIAIRGDKIGNEIVPTGYYCLLTMTLPKPSWLKRKNFRAIVLPDDDFIKIKQQYQNCCATCGAIEGEPHRYYGGVVQLQKGHMNPNLPLKNGNIIPQCQYCNRDFYKNNFIFNEFGQPITINNPSYILRAPDAIQKEVYALLKQKYEVNNNDTTI